MGLRQIKSYSESARISCEARGSTLSGIYAGAGGLWMRNFAWNFAFFEWKRYLHNRVAEGDGRHAQWVASLDPKNQANLLTFEAATLATYLTFFNMAGDNVKTKMSSQPQEFRTASETCRAIMANHGLLGFTRGGLFKGAYLVAGATVAIGLQERLTAIMGRLY